MLNDFLSSYFGFNKQQRNGLVVLMGISLFLLIIRLSYPYFITPGDLVVKDLPLIRMRIDSSYDSAESERRNNYRSYGEKNKLFVFDPNTVSEQQLLQLGFSQKTAAIFLKFRAKGFRFYRKEDLKKVFGVSDKMYDRLSPLVIIGPVTKTERSETTGNIVAPKKQAALIELNSADSLTLLSVSGIGPAYAKRILKYRSLLGGFSDISQLKEVYGFTDELFLKIQSSFTVDRNSIKKLDLNKDEFKVINKHPYVSYELTKTIFDWRRKTSITPTNLRDILNDPVLYARIMPYLAFD